MPFHSNSQHRNTETPKHRPEGGCTFSVFGLRISFGFWFLGDPNRITDFRAPLGAPISSIMRIASHFTHPISRFTLHVP